MSEANGHGTHSPGGPRVFLGMPGYGDLTAGAARGFWRATRRPDSEVYYRYQEGSLLAANFNALWCDALNLARDGKAPRYFAMQHADIEPEDFWLDALIDELEANDLDILGVAVPIKDIRGVTSLALAHPSGDPYRILCRLTMEEVFRLPPTFTSEDVGHDLLLNTGLWVCRFNEEWARRVHFEINDRIVIDANGRYLAQNESEDWFFSRLLHELDLKIGATRKVKVQHRGSFNFPNTHPWGSDSFDKACGLEASVIPVPMLGVAPSGFTLPAISGWLRPEEGERLAELATGKRVLEIGSYYGLSTVCLARTADHVVAIDPHDGRGTPLPFDTFAEFTANLARFGVEKTVYPLRVTFAEWDAPPDTKPFDLIYIDGAHDYGSVAADIAKALTLLADDGLIACHDYRSDADPGVTLAVDELIASGGELLSITDNLAVVKPPARILTPLEV